MQSVGSFWTSFLLLLVLLRQVLLLLLLQACGDCCLMQGCWKWLCFILGSWEI
jgi:hypothetical protein